MTTPFASCENLGCCSDYTVLITEPCGKATLCQPDGLTAVRFTRVLDGLSECEVTITIPGASPDCCSCLADVRTWCHEVHVYRCGEHVWSGPVTRIDYFPDRALIKANDVMAWLDRTPVLAEFEAEDMDIVDIAAGIINANLEDASAAGCLTLDRRPSGIVLESYFSEPFTGYVGDTLRELVGLGLHYTVVGRRIVLMGTQPLSLLGTLTDEDFTGEIGVVEDGALAATQAVVIGAGFEVIESVEGVCGVVGAIREDDRLEEETDAAALAARIVAGGYPTPLQVVVPDGSALSHEAPICLSDMIPGVDIRIFSNATCRSAQADLRLVTVEGNFTPDGDAIQITLAPANADLLGFEG